jgi:hypothetical protein
MICMGKLKNTLYLAQILSNLNGKGPVWKEIIGTTILGVSQYIIWLIFVGVIHYIMIPIVLEVSLHQL